MDTLTQASLESRSATHRRGIRAKAQAFRNRHRRIDPLHPQAESDTFRLRPGQSLLQLLHDGGLGGIVLLKQWGRWFFKRDSHLGFFRFPSLQPFLSAKAGPKVIASEQLKIRCKTTTSRIEIAGIVGGREHRFHHRLGNFILVDPVKLHLEAQTHHLGILKVDLARHRGLSRCQGFDHVANLVRLADHIPTRELASKRNDRQDYLSCEKCESLTCTTQKHGVARCERESQWAIVPQLRSHRQPASKNQTSTQPEQEPA